MAGLYIDHGWDMGWCVVARAGVASGVLDSRRGNPDDGGRLLAQSQWLTALLTRLERAGERLTEIVYEQITFVGKNDAFTLHAHGKQLGNLQRWAALKSQPKPRGIPWDVIKKHVTGHRSAARETMLAVVAAAMPEVTDHNQASAVAVMLTATNKKLHHQPASKPPHARQAERAST
jgi:hypothetical protein